MVYLYRSISWIITVKKPCFYYTHTLFLFIYILSVVHLSRSANYSKIFDVQKYKLWRLECKKRSETKTSVLELTLQGQNNCSLELKKICAPVLFFYELHQLCILYSIYVYTRCNYVNTIRRAFAYESIIGSETKDE